VKGKPALRHEDMAALRNERLPDSKVLRGGDCFAAMPLAQPSEAVAVRL